MELKDFKPKWIHGQCRNQPVYISNKKLLVPCSFFFQTYDLSDNSIRFHMEPKIKIGCCSSLPELGLLAISERKTCGPIYILSYPKMSKISVLKQNSNEMYSAIQFVGLEFLMSLQIKNTYEIDMWKWQSGEIVCFLSLPLLTSEIPTISVSRNPLWWHQCLLESNTRLILVEVIYSEEKFALQISSYFIFIDKDGKLELSVASENTGQKDFQRDVINRLLEPVTIQSSCWLPENNILVATSEGIFKIDCTLSTIYKLADNRAGVSSMALSKSSLFVGHKSGCIDVVSIVGNRWNISETVKLDKQINHIFLSPDYNILTVTTLKGSVFFHYIANNTSTFKILHRAEFGGEVGVGFIGPSMKLCVTAKKNGLIHVIRKADGNILSAFQLDEEISCLAASPMCSYFVIGTNTGFLYFVDITDIRKPKIIHCEAPYDIPIQKLKFDNFGRLIFASAQNQPVKIWNGLPSSGFTMLGSKKIPYRVKDIAGFNRTKDDETFLFILCENASSSNKDNGNFLIRLKLPPDFNSDFKKYHLDVFGTLSGDALNFQKRKLDDIPNTLDVHYNLGVLLYLPKVSKIRKYTVWSDFAKAKQDDILTLKNISDIRVSPNQFWIAFTDFHGSVSIYSTDELDSLAATEKYYSSENVCKSFTEFSLFSNCLINARENGITICYEWINESNVLRNVPEWVIYCCLQSDRENACLRASEEEGRLDVVSKYTEKFSLESHILTETYDEFHMWIYVLKFYLVKLLHENDSNISLSSETYSLSDDSLIRLSSENRKRLQAIAPDENLKDETTTKKDSKQNAVKILSAINLDIETYNYSSESIDNDISNAQILKSHLEKTTSKKSHVDRSFGKTMKIKEKEDVIAITADLFNKRGKMKNEFNEEFDKQFEIKSSINDQFHDSDLENRRLTLTLPSKAERDLWNASIIKRGFAKFFESSEYLDIGTEHQVDEINKDSLIVAKSSLERNTMSTQKILEDFDLNVEILSEKRRFCDYSIFKSEVNIYCMLVLAEESDKFSKWRGKIEKDITFTDDLHKDVEKLLKNLVDVGSDIKDLNLMLLKIERRTTNKIDTKCDSMKLDKEMIINLKWQPPLELNEKSQNPYWNSCPKLSMDDLAWISNENLRRPVKTTSEKKKSSENIKHDWIKICNKKIHVLEIGVILRNLQTQLMHLTEVDHLLADAKTELEVIQRVLQNVFKYMSLLMSTFNKVFKALLETHLENENINGEPERKIKLFSLRTLSFEDNKIRKNIDREVSRIVYLHELLEESEKAFCHIDKLKSEICTKISISHSKFSKLIEDVKGEVDEFKENFENTKRISDKVLEENKNKLSKTLTPCISCENKNQEKDE